MGYLEIEIVTRRTPEFIIEEESNDNDVIATICNTMLQFVSLCLAI